MTQKCICIRQRNIYSLDIDRKRASKRHHSLDMQGRLFIIFCQYNHLWNFKIFNKTHVYSSNTLTSHMFTNPRFHLIRRDTWDIVLSTFHDSLPTIYREEKDEASPVKTPSGKSVGRFLLRMEVRVAEFFAGRLVAGEKQHGRNGGIRCHSRILSGSFYPFVRSKSCGRRVHLFVTWPASWTSRNGEDAASAGQTPRNLRPGGSPSPPGTTPSFLHRVRSSTGEGIGNLSLKR